MARVVVRAPAPRHTTQRHPRLYSCLQHRVAEQSAQQPASQPDNQHTLLKPPRICSSDKNVVVMVCENENSMMELLALNNNSTSTIMDLFSHHIITPKIHIYNIGINIRHRNCCVLSVVGQSILRAMMIFCTTAQKANIAC